MSTLDSTLKVPTFFLYRLVTNRLCEKIFNMFTKYDTSKIYQ